MRHIDTILFDFDGTVMDTNDIIIQSWQHTYRSLRGAEEDVDRILKTFGEPLEYSMEHLFPEVPLEESLEIYRSYQRDNFLTGIHLFPGIRELLDELQAREYRMALVTSRLQHTTWQALEHFDLTKYFSYVVTADDVTRHKPDPQSIDIALEKLGSDPADSAMIGDTLFDILCAKNAGVLAVLVSWSLKLRGMKIEDFAPGEEPDHILQTPARLLELI